MHIICPHCQHAIERGEAASAEEILCPECGATFRLDRGETGPWNAPPDSGLRILEQLGGGGRGWSTRLKI